MLQAIGRFFGFLIGSIVIGTVILLLAVMLLGSVWLDGAGVEQDAVVAAKYERISFSHAGWSRVLEVGLQREDGPMADIRRAMLRQKDEHAGMVGIEKVRVASDVYDRVGVGQTVPVKVQPQGFFKNLFLFPQVRLAGQTTSSIAYSLYESAWPVPQFLLSMVPAGLLGWLAARNRKRLWFGSAACFFLALAYWLTPLSDRRPEGVLAVAEGKVVALRLVDQVLETDESDGVDALVPHLIVGVEFVPDGGNGPVVAVDRVDAPSVNLKEGSQVRVEYQRSDPRRAILLDAERTWWWMNLLSVGQYVAIVGGLLFGWWLLKLFFKGLLASRKA
jgi:hypothetical protein